jgi:hypothetical protein
LFHQNIAKSRRAAYNNYLKDKELKNKILAEIDFKQKFLIGMSLRQVSRELNTNGLLKIFYIDFQTLIKRILLILLFIKRICCFLCC